MTERAMLYRYRRIGRMLICWFCIGLLCASAGWLCAGGRAGAVCGEEAAQPETRIDSVPCLCQYPAFPTGCVTYYEKEKTEKAYTALGCQAVVVTAA